MEELIVLGDFNGRVGNDYKNSAGVAKDNRLPEANDLILSNTFFQHKEVYKFTREVKSRAEKSTINL